MNVEVKIARLDWRSTQGLMNSQVNQMNNFLVGKTLLHVAIADEWIVGIYVITGSPLPPAPTGVDTKFKAYRILEELGSNPGATEIANVEATIKTFLLGATALARVHQAGDPDGGFLLVQYEE